MVGTHTTNTETGRSIIEIEVTEHGRLDVASSRPTVEPTTIVDEPGESRLVRVGHGRSVRDPNNAVLQDSLKGDRRTAIQNTGRWATGRRGRQGRPDRRARRIPERTVDTNIVRPGPTRREGQ